MAIMTVTVVPLRLTGLVLIQLVAWALAKVALIGVKEEELLAEPITGWRK